ncbi:MAG: chromosomal replication initiator protein DnaA [Calditrichaeota bacterium]|nr:MAG: chromosomal replication initiator protein DnaA [Calditrichota bacterium]MBL1204473.1 chromosomal replication initiator protein DnaA [Calditrichota bacterium]NOG44302.1 chromosomal replication initiator protein DnaA [Calditrichota bacterium]
MSENASLHLTHSLEETWLAILDVIEDNINKRSFSTWFAPVKALKITEDFIEVSVPNRFFCEWIDNHYSTLVQNAITQVIGDSKKIKYLVKDNSNSDSPSPYTSQDWQHETEKPAEKVEIDLPFSTRINERYHFDNFIVGDNNNFATAASKAVGEAPGKTNYNPLIIYGQTGLGKTHLIQAIGNRAMLKSPATKVFYASSETFTSHFINAIQRNKVSEFSAFYRSCDILLLDDIQFFSKKGKTQEEFFHTFNDLHQNGKQIVLTSDRPINEIVGLEERLISRFKWGLIVDIQAPDFETRLAILRKKCDESELDIPADVLEYLAVNLVDNVRELEGALTKIMAQVTFTAAEPTISLARNIVAEIAKPDKQLLNIDGIVEYCAKVFDVPKDHIRAKSRKRNIVKARQVAMYLSKQLTNHSLVSIGLHFGGRDHSTVIHGIDSVTQQISEEPVFKNKMESMKKHLEYNR